jgi:hypothetical protein
MLPAMPQLTLFEEVLLIDAYENTGTKFGKGAAEKKDNDIRATKELGGAVLAELAVTGRIRVELAKPDKHSGFHSYDDSMTVTDPTPYGDPEADAILTDVRERPERSVLALVGRAADDKSERYGDKSTLRTRLLRRMVEQGVLRVTHTKTLGIFPGTYYPIVDDSAATDALARLDRVLHGETPEPRTGALAMLVAPPGPKDAGSLAFPGIPKRQLKALYDRLREGGWCEKLLLDTLTAIAVACHFG